MHLQLHLYGTILLLLCSVVTSAQAPRALAPDPVVIYSSPEPEHVFPRSPAILRLDSGRLVFSMELNLNAKRHLPDIQYDDEQRVLKGFIHISDDGGKTFRQTSQHPLMQARPFLAGEKLYLLGHQGDLGVMVSEDQGETWSAVSWLSEGQQWHAAPCNVRYAHGKIYLVMEREVPPALTPWPIHRLAPVVMAASLDDDLTKRASWTFSNEVTFQDMAKSVEGIQGMGVPFYRLGPQLEGKPIRQSRPMGPMGWLETNIVAFPDAHHIWHDPTDRTMYLYMRSYTGLTNYACLAKAVESEDGSITVGPVEAPSGKDLLYLPLPGGHLKFFVLYDDVSKTYWLASNQATDSTRKPESLPKSRYMLADNQRDRLVLHFSYNAVDWIFAGLIDQSGDDRQPRSYPSMTIDGEDLVVVARSGDAKSKNAHDGNIVTLHRVADFRGLIY